MKSVAFLFIMLLAATTEGQLECNQPPVVIDSLPAFECSLLSNKLNIHNLTKAFFPTNGHRARAVKVYYHINKTISPNNSNFSLLESFSNSTKCKPPQCYEFRWFASAVLGFIEPEVLTGFSLHTLKVLTHHVDLTIAPLISDDEDWVRGLLNDATTWVSLQ